MKKKWVFIDLIYTSSERDRESNEYLIEKAKGNALARSQVLIRRSYSKKWLAEIFGPGLIWVLIDSKVTPIKLFHGHQPSTLLLSKKRGVI